MLRKTKRDEPRLAGSASKRPALATISNIQTVNANNDLGKVIQIAGIFCYLYISLSLWYNRTFILITI